MSASVRPSSAMERRRVRSSTSSSSLHAVRPDASPRRLLALALLCLRSYTDQPLPTVSVTSLLVSCFMHFWIVSLSPAMGAADFFARVFYLALLGFLVSYEATPFAGMAALYFSTLHSAGLLGHAVAEHLQRNESDLIHGPSRKRPGPPLKSMSVLSLACALRALWVACTYTPGDTAAAVVEFSLVASACLYLWVCIVHVWLLHSSLLSGDDLGMMWCSGMMIFCAMTGIVGTLFGGPGFVCLTWLIVMAISGMLGYSIGIYHRYQKEAS